VTHVDDNSEHEPFADAFKIVKTTFFKNFVNKWSQHKHDHPHCNKTITFDGDWKVWRLKCCYENLAYTSKEFGPIWTGCLKTPNRQSYFCLQHQSAELKFNYEDTVIKLKPADIKPTKKRILSFYFLGIYVQQISLANFHLLKKFEMIKSKLYTMPMLARMIPNFFYVNPPRVLKLGTKKKTYQSHY
jgi:hypothetical protein